MNWEVIRMQLIYCAKMLSIRKTSAVTVSPFCLIQTLIGKQRENEILSKLYVKNTQSPAG